MKQEIRFARESPRAALHGDAAVLARLVPAELRQMIEIDFDVAADEQIEPAVPIVIGEAAAGGPSAAGNTRLLRDVGERAVVIVAIQAVFPESRHVQIFPAVAVHVGGAHAHAPAGVGEPRLVGDVGEFAVPEVAIQRAARRRRILRRRNGQRIDEVDVEQPVAVVIEQRDAAAHRFDDVFLLGRRVMLKGNPRFSGDVAKQDRLRRRERQGARSHSAGECDNGSHYRNLSLDVAARSVFIRSSASRSFCWYNCTCRFAFASSPVR